MPRVLVALPLLLLSASTLFATPRILRPEPTPIPLPRTTVTQDGEFLIDAGFRVAVQAPSDSRIWAGTNRFLQRLRNRTGLFLPQGRVASTDTLTAPGLQIQVEQTSALTVGVDESYALTVTPTGITLSAPTDLGALHGLETLLQLLKPASHWNPEVLAFAIRAATINDAPRFPWRGLMIDSARHFLPIEVIKRNLDGMAAVKLNVLHWHLTEDQGFRVESKVFPRLHEMGSDGDFYTQEQIRDIIAYADARGIRVYPEFDIPGHATAWLVGHPELASVPRDYAIERKWGIFDPAMDPTKETTYEFLEKFLTEMAGLFPDPYLHIGGDEVNGKDWNAAPHIKAYMEENGITDLHALQTRFNQRLLPIFAKLNKRMIGWDETFQPGMPTNIVIHSWRGREAMEDAARQGYQSILSNGYYIDLMQPASFHYLNDPLPADTTLTAEEAARVLGGEATMWSEHVTPETVDSRIWPRLAAIAERLWSPVDVRDVESMYERLDTIAVQLEEHGLTHIKNRRMLARRLTRGLDPEPLMLLADLVEPLKIYQRNADDSYTQFSPYTLLPDLAIADAPGARAFKRLVQLYHNNPANDSLQKALIDVLTQWRDNHAKFGALAFEAPALMEAYGLSYALKDLAILGLAALNHEPSPLPQDKVLALAREPVAKVELQVVDAVESLLPRQ
ncbi:beta-N-acetylhexosaminidase [Actomonas aquatica]|uniref:Family 20 glycosylhydrolase n=1 Tax=Actomonas aquatica TaxID=2866162 RepID=A0ABZ1C843_9BACT|nr:family 20 glycosylhydrolase [Opitutus sp. WL0086]WRQ87681.1 family 20 glycosylhydrolase [Opitutus sp. WL0086]